MEHDIQTAAELLAATDIGRCELVRGELTVMNAAGGRHGRIAMRLGHAIFDFVERHELGEVLAAETGFFLARDPDTVRAPDVSFVRSGRDIGQGFVEGAPNLAVEVLSPSDRPGYVREKVAEWLEAGAEAVWVVDPQERTVTAHVAVGEPHLFRDRDVLDGDLVLPGFELALSRLF
jgi:Uma2 family endonuclease